MQQLQLTEPIANCYSGIKFDWVDTQNLCGRTMVDIRIDMVRDSNGNQVQTQQIMTAISSFNSQISTDESVQGKNKIFVVPSSMTRNFINYTVDFSFTISNCYPDKEQARVSVKMVDQLITYKSSDGLTITFPKCPTRRELGTEEVAKEPEVVLGDIKVESPQEGSILPYVIGGMILVGLGFGVLK